MIINMRFPIKARSIILRIPINRPEILVFKIFENKIMRLIIALIEIAKSKAHKARYTGTSNHLEI